MLFSQNLTTIDLMKNYLPKMIINSPIEVFEHTEKSEDFNFASKNEESDLGNSSNQISDSIDRKGQNSSDLEELKQITEKSKEHSDSDDANDSDHKVKEKLQPNQTQISVSDVEDEENEVQEESESDFENKCIQCGNEIIKKKHQENGKHLNICYD